MFTDRVKEYWFSKHYRVVVVKEKDNRVVVSVDTYRKGWFFQDYEEVCVNTGEACLMYKTIENPSVIVHGLRVIKIIVTGVKTRNTVETVNVRWICEGDVNEETAKRLFEASWRLINANKPDS